VDFQAPPPTVQTISEAQAVPVAFQAPPPTVQTISEEGGPWNCTWCNAMNFAGAQECRECRTTRAKVTYSALPTSYASVPTNVSSAPLPLTTTSAASSTASVPPAAATPPPAPLEKPEQSGLEEFFSSFWGEEEREEQQQQQQHPTLAPEAPTLEQPPSPSESSPGWTCNWCNARNFANSGDCRECRTTRVKTAWTPVPPSAKLLAPSSQVPTTAPQAAEINNCYAVAPPRSPVESGFLSPTTGGAPSKTVYVCVSCGAGSQAGHIDWEKTEQTLGICIDCSSKPKAAAPPQTTQLQYVSDAPPPLESPRSQARAVVREASAPAVFCTLPPVSSTTTMSYMTPSSSCPPPAVPLSPRNNNQCWEASPATATGGASKPISPSPSKTLRGGAVTPTRSTSPGRCDLPNRINMARLAAVVANRDRGESHDNPWARQVPGGLRTLSPAATASSFEGGTAVVGPPPQRSRPATRSPSPTQPMMAAEQQHSLWGVHHRTNFPSDVNLSADIRAQASSAAAGGGGTTGLPGDLWVGVPISPQPSYTAAPTATVPTMGFPPSTSQRSTPPASVVTSYVTAPHRENAGEGKSLTAPQMMGGPGLGADFSAAATATNDALRALKEHYDGSLQGGGEAAYLPLEQGHREPMTAFTAGAYPSPASLTPSAPAPLPSYASNTGVTPLPSYAASASPAPSLVASPVASYAAAPEETLCLALPEHPERGGTLTRFQPPSVGGLGSRPVSPVLRANITLPSPRRLPTWPEQAPGVSSAMSTARREVPPSLSIRATAATNSHSASSSSPNPLGFRDCRLIVPGGPAGSPMRLRPAGAGGGQQSVVRQASNGTPGQLQVAPQSLALLNGADNRNLRATSSALAIRETASPLSLSHRAEQSRLELVPQIRTFLDAGAGISPHSRKTIF